MKHVGIVAVSAEGAAQFGPHNHPQITMHTYPLADYIATIEADRWEEAGQMLLSSAKTLAGAGAQFLISPDNTIHQALDLVRDQSPLPWLHIAEEVAQVAEERSFRRLGILGTRLLMDGPVYPRKLDARGIAYEMPGVDDRKEINRIIFDELVYGRVEEASRRYLQNVIESLAARGCDVVVLACTELPLLISEKDSPLPSIDSTRTLARCALRAQQYDRRGGLMNWKLIFLLSLFGLAMGIATVFVIPSSVEPIFWCVIFLICAWIIAKSAPGHFFLHGLLVSIVNSVWITAAHVLLFDQYISTHASEAAMMQSMGMAPRVMMLVAGPIVGVVSGLVLGLFAWIASKIVRRTTPVAAAG